MTRPVLCSMHPLAREASGKAGARVAHRTNPARRAVTIQAVSAALALVAALTIYMLDRDWSTALFLVPIATHGSLEFGAFGAAGGYLPSLLHAYAFAVLITLTLPAGPIPRVAGATVWLGIATALEVLQHDAVVASLWPAGATSSTGPVTTAMAAYAARGHFDPADLIAAGLGCLAAFLVTSSMEKRSCKA